MKRLLTLAMLAMAAGAYGQTNGQCLWSKHFGGTVINTDAVYPADIKEDKSGNVVAVGNFIGTVNFGNGPVSSPPGGISSIFIIKYDSAGNYLWSKTVVGAQNQNNSASGVAIDSANNIIVVGSFASASDFGGISLTNTGWSDIFIAKYSSAGVLLSARRFGGSGGQQANKVVLDSSDNIYLVGQYGYYGTAVDFGGGPLPLPGGTAVLYYNAFVAKLTSAYGYSWAHGYGGTADAVANAITIDGSGNVGICGSFKTNASFGGSTFTNAGGYDIFVAEYSSSGVHSWSTNGGGTADDKGLAAQFDTSGNLFVTGEFQRISIIGGSSLTNTTGFPGLFIAKYSSSGSPLLSRGIVSQSPSGLVSGKGVTIDGYGKVFLTGWACGGVTFDPNVGSIAITLTPQIFIAKLSGTDGSTIWARDASSGYSSGASLSLSANNNVLWAGFYGTLANLGCGQITSANYDGFVSKLSNSGPFTFSPTTYGPLTSNQSRTITVTYTAPSDSSSSSNALVFTDNSGVTIAPITGGPPNLAPNNLVVTGVTNGSVGTVLSLLVSNNGTPPFSYQWRQNSNVLSAALNISAITNLYTTNNAQLAQNGWYDVIVTNAYGSATSTPVYVNLTVPFNPNMPNVAGSWSNYATSFNTLIVSNTVVGGNNRVMIVPAYAYSGAYNNSEAWSLEPNPIIIGQPLGGYHVVLTALTNIVRTNYATTGSLDMWSLTSPPIPLSLTPQVNVQMDGSSLAEGAAIPIVLTNASLLSDVFETPVSWSGTDSANSFDVPSTNGEIVVDVLVSSSQQFTPSVGQTLISSIRLPVQQTWLQASYKPATYPTTTMGWGGSFAEAISHAAVAVKPAPPPIILTQPLSTNIPLYTPFSLSVNTIGSDSSTYTWKKNFSSIASTNLSGTTTTNLQFVTPATNDSGYYTALITNRAGSVMSYPAQVTIYTPPPQPVILNPPVGVTNYYGSNITFGVFASGNPTLLYQWRHNSNIIIGANLPSYSKSNVSTNDQGWYDVQIANSYGSTSSVPVFGSFGPLVPPTPPKVSIRGRMTIRGKNSISLFVPAFTTNMTLAYNAASSFTPRIFQGDTYRVFTLVDSTTFKSLLGFYTADGRVSYVNLTNTSYNDFSFESQVACLTNNRIVVASGTSIPSLPTLVQEYDLQKNGNLPTNAIFNSQFYLSSGSTWMTLCQLSNNGVAVFTYPTSNNIGVSYRSPAGVWTNMPTLSVAGIPGLLPAHLSSAENPSDNSVWLFLNRDSCGCVWAANFYPTNNGLYLSQSNTLLSPASVGGVYTDDSMVPYGELETIYAVTDWTNRTMLLMYPSYFYSVYSVTDSHGNAYYGDTPMTVTSIGGFTNKTLIWFNTNIHTARLSTVVGSAPNSSTKTLTFVQSNPNTFLAGIYPLYQQDLVGGVEGVPVFIDNVVQFSPFYTHPYSHDLVYQSASDSTWHLQIKQ